MATSLPLQVVETDKSGRPVQTYHVDDENITLRSDPQQRRDKVWVSSWVRVLGWMIETFMPAGYPESVTADYIRYRLFNSMQAFSSTIAGLLASRAVLEGIGVGDSSVTATSALLVSIVQDTVSRLFTIVFAARFGTALEPETKRFRFLADIVNDLALLSDTASPMIPRRARIPMLCLSGGLRAICGIAAGGSKGALSQHFAQGRRGRVVQQDEAESKVPIVRGNVGELNAKDGSQETVICTIGMLVGAFILPKLQSKSQIWSSFIALIVVHLTTNYFAVRSVNLHSLNRQRASIVFRNLLDDSSASRGTILSPESVATVEKIFDRGGALRIRGRCCGHCTVGATIETLVKCRQPSDPSLPKIVSLFTNKQFVLWYRNVGNHHIHVCVCLHTKSSHLDILEAWLLAMIISEKHKSSMIKTEIIEASLGQLDTLVNGGQLFRRLRQAGWNLDAPAIETRTGSRYEFGVRLKAE